MNWNIILYTILNTVFVFLFAPLLVSLIKKVKAMCQGRIGTPLFQSYLQLYKLCKKEIVYSDNSSFIMRISPYLNISFLLAASIFVPVVFIPLPESGFGNIILFLYLMVCARFFMALSGLDAGSTFGGMGSSREMTIASIIEPTTLMACAAMSFILKTTSIPEMFGQCSTAPSCNIRPLPGRLFPVHYSHRGNCKDSGRQPGNPSRAYHDSRSHDTGTNGAEAGFDGVILRGQAVNIDGAAYQHPFPMGTGN
jgi:formate hydrogenlyase subunit 4